MLRPFDRSTQRRDVRRYPGRRLVVNDADRLDAVVAVRGELGLEDAGVGTAAPVARNEIEVEIEPGRHLAPQQRELSGLEHQHAVARRKRVAQRGFPRAGTGGRPHEYRSARLEDELQVVEHLTGKPTEIRAAMIQRRVVDRPQYAVGNVRRTRYLQEMAAGTANICLGGRRR